MIATTVAAMPVSIPSTPRRPWRSIAPVTLGALLFAACEAPPVVQSQPAPPIVVRPAPAPAPPAPGAEAPTWRVHKCQRSVLWPAYPGAERDAIPKDERQEPCENCDGGPGKSREDKLAEIDRRRKSDGVCDTRRRDAVATSILALRPPAKQVSTRASSVSQYEHAALVRSALALDPEEEKRLASTGIVVPDRLRYDSYTTAYYDVHRAQLPVYVSVDSILHAVYASHDHFVSEIEHGQLVKRLDAMLGEMHCGLAGAAKLYPADVANDVDLYLTVARTLLAQQPVLSELGKVDERVAELVTMLENPSAIVPVELFGRARDLDTSAFTPRGHYAGELEGFFRAATWLSRVDLNLVSRDTRASEVGYTPDPTETPREAVVALALADLAQRTGALDDVAVLDRAWRTLAGAREDVSLADLVALRAKAKIRTLSLAAAPALRTAIGDGFVRTVNTGPTTNVKRLPVIATLLGPRITPDTVALGGLIAERGPAATGAELGFMLGLDRAREYAGTDAKAAMQEARASLAAAKRGDDLYSAWLDAIRSLAIKPTGATPAFMDGAAFQDLRLNTTLAAYGQLRHNHVLVSAQAYDQGGCEIPDGYVEPAPDTYAALAEYARRGARAFRALDPRDRTGSVKYFTRLEKLMRVLVAISKQELAGAPLSVETKRFLAMIVERRVASANSYSGTFPIATFDGWYLDLFPNIDTGLESPAFIVDWATYDRNGSQGVHYLGAQAPRLGVFVVDTGGKPRWMVGPVATAFQHTGDLESRLTDADALAAPGEQPWAKSYTVASPSLPVFDVRFDRADATRDRWREPLDAASALPANVVQIESKVAHGPVTVELLDHHFVKMAELPMTITVGTARATAPTTPRPIEALRVRRGRAVERFDLGLDGRGTWKAGSATAQTARD